MGTTADAGTMPHDLAVAALVERASMLEEGRFFNTQGVSGQPDFREAACAYAEFAHSGVPIGLSGYSRNFGRVCLAETDSAFKTQITEFSIELCDRAKLLQAGLKAESEHEQTLLAETAYNMGVACEHMSETEAAQGNQSSGQGYRAFAAEYYRAAFVLFGLSNPDIASRIKTTLDWVQNPERRPITRKIIVEAARL